MTEVSFTVVRDVDHWQLHPIAVFEEQEGVEFSEFDSSVFTSKDSCEPMTEEQKIAKDKAKEAEEAEAKLKAEKEAKEKANAENDKSADVAVFTTEEEENLRKAGQGALLDIAKKNKK